MIGGSYRGIVQWKVALLNNPHLKAIFPVVSGYDDYRDRFYSHGRRDEAGPPAGVDGGESEGAGLSSGLRTIHPAPAASDLRHRGDRLDFGNVSGRQWRIRPSIRSGGRSACGNSWDKVRVPVFSVGGWYDNYVESDLDAYARAAQDLGAEPDSGWTVAAQHVDPVRGDGLGTGFDRSRSASCNWNGSTSG